MPRAFLITHRRYNGTEEFGENIRDFSPERSVRIPEYNSNQPTSDGVSDCGSESSSECPDELYNLTKLAEVSLAAAAGTLIHPNNIYHRSLSPPSVWPYNKKLSTTPVTSPTPSSSSSSSPPIATTKLTSCLNDNELSLRERTRLFFERIETERDILESINHKNCIITSELTDVININNKINNKEDENNCLTTKIDDNEVHECPDCGKKYSTSSNLARHRQTHRSLGDKKARRCPHCDKVYVSMPAFSMHVRTHNQGCKCHYCGKCFSRPWLLQGHIRTHTGEKPFKCTICNKAFADKSNLRAHVQTHSNTKPHVCGRCGKAFALKSYLYKHEESSCMRAHSRPVITDKKDDDIVNLTNTNCIGNKSTSTSTCGPISSPTSVIVACPGVIESTPVTVSSIIQHTKSLKQDVPSDFSSTKKRCWNNDDNDDDKSSDIFKRMNIIRSTVISTNPDHKIDKSNFNFNDENNRKNNSHFDFNDSSRSSVFSRSTSLAIA